MKRNKDRTKFVTNNDEQLYVEEMHGLADAISECEQHTPSLCDAFDDYVEDVRTKIHSNPHIFRSRLVKGYNALLHALKENENSQEKPL